MKSIYWKLCFRMSKKEIPEYQKKRIEEIGLLLKNWRINEGQSRSEFCEWAEIHPNSLYHIENCRKNNSLRHYNFLTLLKCIDATGLTVSQFFDGIQ